MFDVVTANLLRAAPAVPGLDPEDIPAILTRHYAKLVAFRMRGSEVLADEKQDWSLDRIADTYEIIASIQTDGKLRRASSFVAATAQQILSRRETETNPDQLLPAAIDRSRVDPTIASAILFLGAEQYADANEAALGIKPSRDGQSYEAKILAEHIRDLALGKLREVLDRADRWRKPIGSGDLEEFALAALFETLVCGVEMLAAKLLNEPMPEACKGRFDGANHAFQRVLEVSISANIDQPEEFGESASFAYPGPRHLASLLLIAESGISDAALTKIRRPDGADEVFWEKWLRYRAEKFPFVWRNHRKAVAKGFYQTGNSAVVVLPTGAGKTTLSSLKIAGVLARGKKVVFLAPTHALVEQLTDDLQEMFPEDLLGSAVSSDFDLLSMTNTQLNEIEIMTPERCLAMLSFAPDAFSDVGLLVFDECHLLSPQSGKIRRAIDSMLCVLGFNHAAPDADMLFLSAMLKNGKEFGEWIGTLTERPCVSVDLLWKPSRQARGVVIYENADRLRAVTRARKAQTAGDQKSGKVAKTLRAAAAAELLARPWAVWGLQHNWNSLTTRRMITTRLLKEAVLWAGELKDGQLSIKPNANKTAAQLAVTAARNGLKTIVFVNTKRDAISSAKIISEQIGGKIKVTKSEKSRWDALEAELGGLKHSIVPLNAVAVPHNGSMLRLERDLAERMFKRPSGAAVIVATPTLAQGLNLPAHLSILAGDKRSSANRKGREALEAHEILNAAARAGRAGHLANGVVLLVPEPNIFFERGKNPSRNLTNKLTSVLPEDDRCVTISDALEVVLDRIMQGDEGDRDVKYFVNRMAAFDKASNDTVHLFDLERSLGAFSAKRRNEQSEFDNKVEALIVAIAEQQADKADISSALLASQSGLSIDLLMRLKSRIDGDLGKLPVTVKAWLLWTTHWLSEDDDAREYLLFDVEGAIKGACGAKKQGRVTVEDIGQIQPGLLGWIEGFPISKIEAALGGEPGSDEQTKQKCPRARELVGSVIPRGFAFIMGLVAHVVQQAEPFEVQENLNPSLVECLGVAVRKGLDSEELVAFSCEHKAILSRVQLHSYWAETSLI